MKVNRSSLFWGILLIAGGGLALAQQMGYLDQLPDSAWVWIFGLISLVGLVAYLTSGLKEWGWLFPFGIFGGLAATVGFAVSGYDNPAMASPLFFGLLIPFGAAYLLDRSKNWWALIPGGVMLFLALVLLMADNVRGEWIGSMFLFMISFPFLIVYLNNRETNWWALIPGGVLLFLSLIVALSTSVDGEWIGALFLFGIALSFFVVYLNNRTRNWWALIPAGVMFFLSLIVVLSTSVRGEWIGALFLFAVGLSFLVVYLNNRARQWALLVAYILFVLSVAPAMASFRGDVPAYYGSVFLLAVALPFFVVYFRSADNWWAIIPAGVMTTLAVVATLGIAGWIRDTDAIGLTILMGGLAATFAVLWLRHAKLWARDVTIVLAVLAVVAVFFGSDPGTFWPAAFILGGAYLLYTALRPKTFSN